jgi:flagellar hook assembly protein FlgD
MLSKGVLSIIELPLTKQKLFVFQEGFVVYDFAKGSVRNEISEAVTLPAPFLNDGSAEVSFYIPDNGINYKFVKIFDLKGRLVKKITANFSGNRITWNGKGDDGELASSGIYQFIVYSEENSQEFLRGKMAIVRK